MSWPLLRDGLAGLSIDDPTVKTSTCRHPSRRFAVEFEVVGNAARIDSNVLTC